MAIEIEIMVLPDKTRRKARIDSSVSFEKLKADMVNALELGDPNEYEMSIAPRLTRQPLQNLKPSQGDLIILFRKEDFTTPSVELL